MNLQTPRISSLWCAGAVILVCGCSRVPVKAELASSIGAAAATGDVVDLARIADFAWDEVCILGAFLRPEDISGALGFEWHGKRTGSNGSLIFVDAQRPRSDSTVAAHVPLRTSSWFIAASGCVPRDEAKFLVNSPDGVTKTLVPVNRKYRSKQDVAPA